MGKQNKQASAADIVNEKNKNTRDQKYNQYVKDVTPKFNGVKTFFQAYLVGGLICTLGQGLNNLYSNMGAEKELSKSYAILSLVFLAILFTGFGVYQKLAKFGGAGCFVPITGFANAVAAPAVEYKKEGQVFGIGAKIFTIAGPVILYGIFSSWVLGLIYYILKLLGVV